MMKFLKVYTKVLRPSIKIAGKLFSVGYEAFKLPGYLGFDLIVTNQKG